MYFLYYLLFMRAEHLTTTMPRHCLWQWITLLFLTFTTMSLCYSIIFVVSNWVKKGSCTLPTVCVGLKIPELKINNFHNFTGSLLLYLTTYTISCWFITVLLFQSLVWTRRSAGKVYMDKAWWPKFWHPRDRWWTSASGNFLHQTTGRGQWRRMDCSSVRLTSGKNMVFNICFLNLWVFQQYSKPLMDGVDTLWT